MNENIFEKIENELISDGFQFERTDFNRPWGGFLVIVEEQVEKFINKFFPNQKKENLTIGGKISPKILIIAPHKRLSWQYHLRRSEVWIVIKNKVGVVKSDTDKENEVVEFNVGDKIELAQGVRHRIVGHDEYCIMAEIWQHTDINNPSDEDDIIRLQDDYGR